MAESGAAIKMEIRQAKSEDMPAVMDMIQELADFEKMSDGPKINAEVLKRDFEADPPFFKCIVTEVTRHGEGGVPVNMLIGYMIYFYTYSTWEGKSMMLEDIYVKPEYRSVGTGKSMVQYLAKQCLQLQCSRLDFHVLKWNPARSFYHRLGAVCLTETEDWLFYRLTADSMRRVVQ